MEAKAIVLTLKQIPTKKSDTGGFDMPEVTKQVSKGLLFNSKEGRVWIAGEIKPIRDKDGSYDMLHKHKVR